MEVGSGNGGRGGGVRRVEDVRECPMGRRCSVAVGVGGGGLAVWSREEDGIRICRR